MSKSKQKGTFAETAVRKYLERWFPGVKRAALTGNLDEGDITGVPRTAIEIKNCGVYNIPAWLKELDAETVNARAEFGVLIVKPRGVGEQNVGEWWAIQRLDRWAAGHADLLGVES